MDSSRVAQVKEVLDCIGDVMFWEKKNEAGDIIGFITDYKLSGSKVSIKELEELGFVVFQPRHISDLARDLMEQFGDTHRKYYEDGICTFSMIVDSLQEDKSKLLAEKIIEFYNIDKRNYDTWYDMVNPKYGNKLAKLQPFYDCGELGKILTKVGFSIKMLDKGKISVKGKTFTLVVDGKSGEITEDLPVQKESYKRIYGENRVEAKGIRKVFRSMFGTREQ